MSNDSLAQIYDSLAPRYAAGDGINDFYTLPIIEHFCPSSASSALEVCCGVGRITVELAKHIPSVWGIDLSPEMIACARRRSQAASNKPVFIQGDLSTHDFGDQTFDYIYGAYFTAYFEIGALLQKLIPLTRAGGRIFFIDGLQGPGIGSFRLRDIARQYTDYARFMRRHGMSFNGLGWFVHRWKRKVFLASEDWKKVERWKRDHRSGNCRPTWAEQFSSALPDAKTERITPRLAYAIWDRK